MKNILYGVLAFTLLAACDREPELSEPVIDSAAGKVIAEADCSGCHGMDGRGETAEIPNLAAQPAEYLVEAMHAYREGRRHHAALQDMTSEMSEADIANIAGYYASLPPLESIISTQGVLQGATSYREGAAVAAVCEECHGEGGNSTTEGIPNLAGQQPIYLIVATQEYKDGSRGHAEKEEMLKGLEQVDVEKMAMYFASQIPAAREAPPFGDPVAGEPLSAICGGCHGARGVSHEPTVPSLASQEPNYLVTAIKAYRDHAREHEDMITDKSDQEIENIAAFYAVQKAEAAGGQPNTVQDLAAICDRCHGPSVGERTLVVPSLNGQSRDYLIRAMTQYRGDDRGSSMMHKMSSGYSDEMIEALATYYAGQAN
ncbi:MAG: c-type cytochrome [Xanthomonadales bacterium]